MLIRLAVCFAFFIFFTTINVQAQDIESQKASISSAEGISAQGKDSKALNNKNFAITAENLAIVKTFQEQLEEAKRQLKKEDIDSTELDSLRASLQKISDQALDQGVLFREPLNDINIRLKQIDASQVEHADLTKQKQQINAHIRLLEESYTDANRLINQIHAQTRELFTHSLTHRIEWRTELKPEVIGAAKKVFGELNERVSSWWEDSLSPKIWIALATLMVPLACAIGIYSLLQKFFRRLFKPRYDKAGNVLFLSHFTKSFFSVFIPLISSLSFFTLLGIIGQSTGLLKDDIFSLYVSFSTAVLLIIFIYKMSCAIFVAKGALKKVILSETQVTKLFKYFLTVLASIIGANYFLDTVFKVCQAPLSLVIFKNLIIVFLESTIFLLVSFVAPLQNSITGGKLRWPNWFQICLIFLSLFPTVAALLGYVSFARYAMQQIVVISAFLSFLYLGIAAGRSIAQSDAFAHSILGVKVLQHYNLSQSAMNQLGLIAGLIIDLIAIIICVPPILMQFGFSLGEIFTQTKNFLLGFQIGNISISILSIILGVGVFFLSLYIIRRLIDGLDKTVMLRSQVDIGVRNSIKTVLGYIAFALAGLIALSVAGFNLSSLAIIAGGLSLGIGFGLQNIVQNFVSGLILLIGRPFKAGDYIQLGTAAGIVKRVNVRATEVETLKKETILIPNSSIMTNNVVNWTRHDRIGRVDIPLSVPNIKDPEEITKILLEIAEQCEEVLKKPKPIVVFSSFDKTTLNFSLNIYVADVLSSVKVSNMINYEINRRFLQEGIYG